MYQIGVCDDEPIFLHHIAELARNIASANNIPCKIVTFGSGNDLHSYFQNPSEPLDLLILDILLKDDNGVQLARRLRQAENNLPIIFITSSMDYVLEGYTVEPVSYLLKPVDYGRLEEALLRAYKKFQKKKILLATPSQTVSFFPDDVLYLEIYNKTLSIHTSDGNTLEVIIPLNVLVDKLPPEQFVQCHRSYIVSLPAISSIRRYEIELENHKRIPVSKTYYQNVQNALLTWCTHLS